MKIHDIVFLYRPRDSRSLARGVQTSPGCMAEWTGVCSDKERGEISMSWIVFLSCVYSFSLCYNVGCQYSTYFDQI